MIACQYGCMRVYMYVCVCVHTGAQAWFYACHPIKHTHQGKQKKQTRIS